MEIIYDVKKEVLKKPLRKEEVFWLKIGQLGYMMDMF